MEPQLKKRRLDLDLYGQQRSLGNLPTDLHTDARTVCTALAREASGRGRRIELPQARVDAVDAALRSGGSFDGVAALREAVGGWRRQTRLRADAEGINAYYDASRSDAYTEKLEGPQTALALRCFELTGLDPEKAPFVLDLGASSLATTSMSMIPRVNPAPACI